MKFHDRLDAAEQLSRKLEDQFGKNPLILALPRGGVPIGWVIASHLAGELDVELVRKFGFPSNPEFALGAVTESGQIYLGIGAQRYSLGIDDVRAFAEKEIERLHERRQLYTPHGHPIDPRGRLVILVDDGIATGSTMIAAVKSVMAKGASRIIVAVPVAARDAVESLLREGVEVVCVDIPAFFMSVGEFYDDFEQVTDEEVIKLLDRKTAPNRRVENGHLRNPQGRPHRDSKPPQ